MIAIKPAEIVGASIGDRVTWTTDTSTWYGTLLGFSREYPGRLVVEITHRGTEITQRGTERDTGRRHIEPERLRLAPKKYVVGDMVTDADEDDLPDGTVVFRHMYLPAFKADGKWYVVNPHQGPRQSEGLSHRPRTIAWLPSSYTDNN